MKARLPKSWDRLPKHEKDIINRVMADEVVKQVVHEQAELQKIWLKKEKCAGEAAAVREKKGYEAEYTDTRIRGLAKTKRKKIRQNVWRG